MDESCSRCGARVESGATWCPQCYTKVRGRSSSRSPILQATSGPLRTPLLSVRPARRHAFLGGAADVGTKVLLTLAIVAGLVWAAFTLDARFYGPGVGVAAVLLWQVWRRHPA